VADEVQGVPAGVTGTPIQGVPAGVTGTPIQGVPAGVTGTSIQGVPAGVTGTPIQGVPAHPGGMLDDIRQRVGSNRQEFLHNVGQRLSDLNEGIGRYAAEGFIPIENQLQKLPLVGPAVQRQLQRDQALVNAPLPKEPERKGSQELGGDLTSLAEWYGGSKLLEGLSFVQKYEVMKPIMEMIKKSPASAKVILGSLRAGTTSGAQTLLHGGSGSDALTSALLTGGLEAGVTGLSEHGARVANKTLQPPPRKIAGEEFPLLASDAPAVKGEPLGSPEPSGTARFAAERSKEPAIREETQQAGQRAFRNIAHDVLENHFREENKIRAGEKPITDPSRLLPESDEPTPYQFHVAGGEEPTPTGEGQIAFDPRKKQTGTKVVEGKGRPAEAPPPLITDDFAGTPEERQAYMDQHVGSGRTLRPRPFYEEFEKDVPADNLPEGYRMITDKIRAGEGSHNVRIIDENDIQRGVLTFSRGKGGKYNEVQHLVLHPDLQGKGLAQEMMRQSGVIDPTIRPGSPISEEGAAAINRFNRRYPSATGPAEPTAPARRGSHREPQFQYLTSIKPGQESGVVTDVPMGGGGPMTVSGPETARAALEAHNDLIDSPDFEKLPVKQQKHITDQRDSLQYQLNVHDSYQAQRSHFGVADAGAAKANTHTMNDAAVQIEQLHQPVFQTLSEATGGRFDKLRSMERAMRRIVRRPSSPEAYENAQRKLSDVRGEMNDMFDDPAIRQKVARPEWQRAVNAYRKAQRLHDLGDFIERFHNISVNWSKELGTRREFKPTASFYRELQNVAAEGGSDLESLIGKDGALNMARIAQMVDTPEHQDAYKGLLQNIFGVIKRNYHGFGGLKGLGVGATAESIMASSNPAMAGLAAKLAGLGFAGAATAEGATRHLFNKLATDAAFNRRFHYAVTHKVPPKIAVPLLTMPLMNDDLEQKEMKHERERARQQKEEPTK
jgi:hypothetical protein